MSEPTGDEVQNENKKSHLGVSRGLEFEFQPHCVALGKWLSHSVPGFPCVYKTNPNTIYFVPTVCQALLTRGFSLDLALKRLETISHPV